VAAVAVTSQGGQLSLGPGGAELLDLLHADQSRVIDRTGAAGTAGDVAELPLLDGSFPERVLLVGVGAGSAADYRRAGAALARRAATRTTADGSAADGSATPRRPRTVATSIAANADDAALAGFVEGLVLGSFRFSRESVEAPAAPVGCFVVLDQARGRDQVVRRALVAARAGWLSRELALTPGNEKAPQWLVDQARAVAQQGGLAVRVRDEAALAAEGFGGILAVGQGSPRPSALIQLGYRPRRAARRSPHVVLVGKGITFDSGGLSLKPGDAMMTMKRDMTGGGVVIATMAGLRDLGVRVRVTGLVAAAENSISGTAQRPGDVVRHYGGRTSEVLNTDAEGRLVLADALAYAAAELSPDVLVDVATLTGAVKVALGQRVGGLYSDDESLADALLCAGDAAGEPLWRLPLVEDYVEMIDSPVADANNAPPGPAGSITAALFLRPFAGGTPWAHLDIASVGDSPVDAYEWTQGATGFGARALLYWLASL
jgi:leucyl aminopeptidase